MMRVCVQWVVVLALALAPRVASAQCMGGMTGGGHQHGEKAATRSEKQSDKKARQALNKLLADEESRAVVLEAILADEAFMRWLIARIAETPEWRALVAERLAAVPADSAAAVPEDRGRSRGSEEHRGHH